MSKEQEQEEPKVKVFDRRRHSPDYVPREEDKPRLKPNRLLAGQLWCDEGQVYDEDAVEELLLEMDQLKYGASTLLKQFVEYLTLRKDAEQHAWLLTPGGLLGWMQYWAIPSLQNGLPNQRRKVREARQLWIKAFRRCIQRLEAQGVKVPTAPAGSAEAAEDPQIAI